MLMGSVPDEVFRLYKDEGIGVSLYVALRWRLCPFKLIESMAPRSGRIVDVGCGYGLLANYMAIKSGDRDISGYDSSAGRIAVAKSTEGRSGGKVRFYNNEVDLSSFSGLAGVVMTDFLHHVEYTYQERLIREAYDALAEGGRLVILDVDEKPGWKYLSVKAIDRALNPSQKICYRREGDFLELLKKVGFNARSFPAHMGLPLSDVIYLCEKSGKPYDG